MRGSVDGGNGKRREDIMCIEYVERGKILCMVNILVPKKRLLTGRERERIVNHSWKETQGKESVHIYKKR